MVGDSTKEKGFPKEAFRHAGAPYRGIPTSKGALATAT